MATIHLRQTTAALPEQFLAQVPARTVKAMKARNYQPRQAQS